MTLQLLSSKFLSAARQSSQVFENVESQVALSEKQDAGDGHSVLAAHFGHG